MSDYVNEYIRWLKANMTQRKIRDDLTEITTPFLDRNNDYTQVYIENKLGGFKITDAGYILDDLSISGMDITSSAHRKKILDWILNRFGLQVDEKTNEIFAYANRKEAIPKIVHRVLQGMLDINDMFYLNNSAVTSMFHEDVKQFFKKHQIYSSQNVSYAGVSGFYHAYDFLLQENKKNPGRLVRLMNRPQKATFERFAFAWNDIKPMLESNGDVKTCIILINDMDVPKKKNIMDIANGFSKYGMRPFLWSKREQNIDQLA